MSRRARRNHTPAFKAKVALAAVKADRALAQLAELLGSRAIRRNFPGFLLGSDAGTNFSDASVSLDSHPLPWSQGTCASLQGYRSELGKIWPCFASCRFLPLVRSASFRIEHQLFS